MDKYGIKKRIEELHKEQKKASEEWRKKYKKRIEDYNKPEAKERREAIENQLRQIGKQFNLK